jgi:hypothetical protein
LLALSTVWSLAEARFAAAAREASPPIDRLLASPQPLAKTISSLPVPTAACCRRAQANDA